MLLLAPLGVMLLAGAGLTWKSLSADAADPEFRAARQKAEERAARALTLAEKGVPPAGPLTMLANDPQTRGPELFAQHCASCHRLGEQGPPPAEANAPDLSGFGSKAWVLAVLDQPDAPHLFGNTPFKGMMESFTKPPADPALAEGFEPMPAAEQQAIAAFLEAEARGDGAKGSEGEKLVKQKCTSCHRLDGSEPLDPESLAPELRGWASVGWIIEQIRAPGSGKTYPAGAVAADLKGHMPGFGEELTPGEISLLARWLHTTALATAMP